eukprot:2456003-Ditylum_brightwellii.AAC.1
MSNVFSISKLLENICKAERSPDIFSTSRVSSTNLVGDLHGTKENYHVTYDSEHSNSFLVERNDSLVRNFKELERGLFYTVMNNEGYILLNTVADNKTKCSPCDYSCA